MERTYIDKVFIPLKENDKTPIIKDWQTQKQTPFYKFHNNCNTGMLCGKINNILVVDVDIKRHKEEALAFIEKYNLLNTCSYIIKSWSGGYHFFYQYDENFTAKFHPTINDLKYVDIMASGFIVSEGSKVNDKIYECIYGRLENVGHLAEQNKKLFNLLLKLNTKKENSIKETKEKINNLDYSTKQLTDDQLENLNKMLFEKEFTKKNINFADWFPVICVFKKYNLVELFDKWSVYNTPLSYDKKQNMEIWQNIKPWTIKVDITYIEYLYNKLKKLDYENIFKICSTYKKIVQEPENTTVLNIEYLTNKDRSINAIINTHIKENKITIIKSPMGSGKTTMMNTKLNENVNINLISVCSRRSLVNCQEKLFNNENRKVLNYLNYQTSKQEFKNYSDNIIIQLDSLEKFINIRDDCIILNEKDEYILYLDEFSSLLRHMATSDTMKGRRRSALKILIDVIHNAHKVIITDADINDAVFKFFDLLNCEYKFINNVFLKKTDVKNYKVVDIPNLKVIEKLINTDKDNGIIFCSDAKIECDTVYKYLTTHDVAPEQILKITSKENNARNKELFDTDKWEQYRYIIYSPSVVYGVDFVPVVPYNVVVSVCQCSINPLEIGQMIFRCRNIKNIYTVYENGLQTKRFLNIHTLEDAQQFYVNTLFIENSIKAIIDNSNEFNDIENLNNFLFNYHFLQNEITKNDYEYYINESISTKGIITLNYKDTNNDTIIDILKSNLKEEAKVDNIEYEINKFNTIVEALKKNISKDEIKKTEEFKPLVERIDYLNLECFVDIAEFKEYIYDDRKFKEHYTTCLLLDTLNNGDKITKIYEKSLKNDFQINIDCSILGKIQMLKLVKDGKDEYIEKLSKSTRIKYDNDKHKFISKVSNSIGDKIMTRQKHKEKGKQIYNYVFDEEVVKKHNKLLEFRNNK